MPAAVLARHLGPERAAPASMALGALGACALVALVDPSGGAPYPTCPTRALFGLDCPVCGTLRGLHSLSRGRLAEALDHNVLLLVAVPLGALLWARWVLSALGWRRAPATELPRWAVPLAVAVALVFTVARNLPVPALAWLGSGA